MGGYTTNLVLCLLQAATLLPQNFIGPFLNDLHFKNKAVKEHLCLKRAILNVNHLNMGR